MNLGPLYPRQRQPGFFEAVLQLLGHLLGGAALFLGLAAVSWAIGWAVEALNKVHPFNEAVIKLLHGVEVAILYLDIGLSGIVLSVGAFRFVHEISGASRH